MEFEDTSLSFTHFTKRVEELSAWLVHHGLDREVLGGNGIVLENKAMKHFMVAEAVYTFEGTHQINTLIVSRAITGVLALA